MVSNKCNFNTGPRCSIIFLIENVRLAQCAETILDKIAKVVLMRIKVNVSGIQNMVLSFKGIASINKAAWSIWTIGEHGQNRQSCLVSGFYALESRISNKIYSEPLKNAL